MPSIPFLFGLIILPCLLFAQEHDNPLSACPKSPNCFRSEFNSKKAAKLPLVFKGNYLTSKEQLKKVLQELPNAKFEGEEAGILKYTFVTKLGKFVDDVHFYLDKEQQCIHFRSASRVGWSDMGANRRRMKKIMKVWNL